MARNPSDVRPWVRRVCRCMHAGEHRHRWARVRSSRSRARGGSWSRFISMEARQSPAANSLGEGRADCDPTRCCVDASGLRLRNGRSFGRHALAYGMDESIVGRAAGAPGTRSRRGRRKCLPVGLPRVSRRARSNGSRQRCFVSAHCNAVHPGPVYSAGSRVHSSTLVAPGGMGRRRGDRRDRRTRLADPQVAGLRNESNQCATWCGPRDCVSELRVRALSATFAARTRSRAPGGRGGLTRARARTKTNAFAPARGRRARGPRDS